MFKTRLDVFWERFSAILEFWKFFDFLRRFRRLDPPWNTGQIKFSKKLPQNMFKTRLRTFGNDFGQLWNFEIFSIFWKHFEYSTLHGTLGKKIFSKKLPQNMFKTLLDNLGTILGIFGILKIFDFVKTFRRLDPPWNTGQQNFKKITSKHVQNTFGHFWERFWAIMEVWKIFDFLKTFRRLDHPWNTGQRFFSEKLPQNLFKTRLDNLGTILGIFGNLKIFNFFNNISKTRPSMEHWAKKLFEKVNPTLVQNTFAHFWERFWAIMEVWKFFHFLKTFRRLDPPWNTGQKNFSEKLPQNMFKTRLDTFGNDFVQLWNFEKILIFWKHFEDSTIHGTLGKNFFRKKYPKTCSKHVWTIWERFWAFLEIWKICSFFTKTFRRLDTPWNTGQKIFSKKITPKTCSKHVWTVFGNEFGHFWKFEIFLIFWKHFEDSTLHGTLGKKFFKKNSP